MAANQSKAQVRTRFADARVAQPERKMAADELRAHLGRRSARFADKRTKRNRDRSAQRRHALRDAC